MLKARNRPVKLPLTGVWTVVCYFCCIVASRQERCRCVIVELVVVRRHGPAGRSYNNSADVIATRSQCTEPSFFAYTRSRISSRVLWVLMSEDRLDCDKFPSSVLLAWMILFNGWLASRLAFLPKISTRSGRVIEKRLSTISALGLLRLSETGTGSYL